MRRRQHRWTPDYYWIEDRTAAVSARPDLSASHYEVVSGVLAVRAGGQSWRLRSWPRPEVERLAEWGDWVVASQPPFDAWRLGDWADVPVDQALPGLTSCRPATGGAAIRLFAERLPSDAVALAQSFRNPWRALRVLARTLDGLGSWLAETAKIGLLVALDELAEEDGAIDGRAGSIRSDVQLADLARVCRLPADRATLGVLHRLQPGVFDAAHLRLLRRTLTDADVVARLAAHPVLSRAVLDLLCCADHAWATPELVAELGACSDDLLRARLGRWSFRRITKGWRIWRPSSPWPRPVSIDALVRIARELAFAMTLERMLRDEGWEDPDVSLPPGAGMHRLESMREVIEEWMQQDGSHVVLGRPEASGAYAAFRLTHPERASLCVDRDRDGVWNVSALEVAGGRPVRRETRLWVDEWLESVQATD
jgi:hypothetical protein